jgi:hypothetical protein
MPSVILGTPGCTKHEPLQHKSLIDAGAKREDSADNKNPGFLIA